MSLNSYQTVRRHISEDSNLHIPRHWKPKPQALRNSVDECECLVEIVWNKNIQNSLWICLLLRWNPREILAIIWYTDGSFSVCRLCKTAPFFGISYLLQNVICKLITTFSCLLTQYNICFWKKSFNIPGTVQFANWTSVAHFLLVEVFILYKIFKKLDSKIIYGSIKFTIDDKNLFFESQAL